MFLRRSRKPHTLIIGIWEQDIVIYRLLIIVVAIVVAIVVLRNMLQPGG
jgi:hypothetical protein